MAVYLYRRGDGNEGNYPRSVVQLDDTDCPFLALKYLVVNDYIPGKVARKHITDNIEIDADYPQAVVYEGPNGENAFGAAWMTAELQLLVGDDLAQFLERNAYLDTDFKPWTLKSALDTGAMRMYRRDLKKGA